MTRFSLGPLNGEPSYFHQEFWCRNARAGDEEALTRLFAPHLRRLYCSALRILGRPEDAEDALQDGLLLALRNLPRFENRSLFSTWLTRIVVNAALTQRRRNNRLRAFLTSSGEPGTGEPSLIDLAVDRTPNPEQSCGQEERSRILQQALRRFPSICRSVLYLYAQGLGMKEIAAELGIPEGTVKSHVHRACRTLRKNDRFVGGLRNLRQCCQRLHCDRSDHRTS